jgi:phosphoglycolate phosphatase
MRKNCFLFDLDGTVVNSEEGIMKSLEYALTRLGIPLPEDYPQRLRRFIGPPIRDSFRMQFALSEQDIERGVEFYRERYGDVGMYELAPYDGIPELIRTLRNHGCTIVLATSKPQYYAEKILAHIGLADCFDLIVGSEMDGSRSKKVELIEHAIAELNLERGGMVMIGDMKYDIIGARETGIDHIGVLYGFGIRQELEEAGAARITETVEDLTQACLFLCADAK